MIGTGDTERAHLLIDVRVAGALVPLTGRSTGTLVRRLAGSFDNLHRTRGRIQVGIRIRVVEIRPTLCERLRMAGDCGELGDLSEKAVVNKCHEFTDDRDGNVTERVQALGHTAFDTVFDGDDTSIVSATRNCLNDLRDRHIEAISSAIA